MTVWPEVITAKSENRHEITLAGAAISKRIGEDGLDPMIFQLTSLNLLTISDTCLSSVPDEIGHLVNLVQLILFGNKIEEFNENITSLPKLKLLDLSRNQLKSVPESLNNLKELTDINFSLNQIETMPKLVDLPKLMNLNVCNNKLTQFPDVEGANLPHLADVNFAGNQIEALPHCIASSLPAVKKIDLSDNRLKTLPGELGHATKLKELNLKGNKLDNRLMKMLDQTAMKKVLEYISEHYPSAAPGPPAAGKGKGKKGGNKKKEAPLAEVEAAAAAEGRHTLRVEPAAEGAGGLRVRLREEQVAGVRPYVVCCAARGLRFTADSFRRFLARQAALHDGVCARRASATIATHDLDKIAPGELVYTALPGAELRLVPLGRAPCSGEELRRALLAEAEAEAALARRDKRRGKPPGVHRYLHLLEGKPRYPCLLDASGTVISFPPITNSENTKMSPESTSMLVEVTSQVSAAVCRAVMDEALREFLLLPAGEPAPGAEHHTLTVQQVKVVDMDGNLKSVYPSRADCVYKEADNIAVLRLPKT